MAQKKNSIVVELKKLVKQNPRFYVHANRVFDADSWSDEAIFTVTAELSRDGRGNEHLVKIDVPGLVGNGHNDETESYVDSDGRSRLRYSGVYRPSGGYWSLWANYFADLILTLPDDANIKFKVSLDNGTSELHVVHGLHTDRLYLCAEWTRGSRQVRRQFMIDSSTGYHNSARFGSPKSEAQTRCGTNV